MLFLSPMHPLKFSSKCMSLGRVSRISQGSTFPVEHTQCCLYISSVALIPTGNHILVCMVSVHLHAILSSTCMSDIETSFNRYLEREDCWDMLFIHLQRDSISSPGIKSEHPKTALGHVTPSFYWNLPWKLFRENASTLKYGGKFTGMILCLSRREELVSLLRLGQRMSMYSPILSVPFLLEVTLSTESRHSILPL